MRKTGTKTDRDRYRQRHRQRQIGREIVILTERKFWEKSANGQTNADWIRITGETK